MEAGLAQVRDEALQAMSLRAASEQRSEGMQDTMERLGCMEVKLDPS